MFKISGYQLFETIYRGHNSVICRGAKTGETQQAVIIKLPLTPLPNTKEADKLRHEGEIYQKINSKYVIKAELKSDPTYGYILLEEDTQAEVLAGHIPANGLEPLKFLKFALQLAEGLRDIHRSNVVHNDIKPSNIILQPETGEVKYMDFGSATLFYQHKQVITVSPYISPEQTGRINRILDYRTDFYSLGVIFYRLLCGKLPFVVNLSKWSIPPQNTPI